MQNLNLLKCYALDYELPLITRLTQWYRGKTSALALQKSWVWIPPEWYVCVSGKESGKYLVYSA